MTGLAVTIAIAMLLAGAETWRRRRYFRRHRAAYDASWHPDRAASQFEDLIDLAITTLGSDIVLTPDYEAVVLSGKTPGDKLLEAVTIVTTRLGVARESVLATYSSELPAHVGANVTEEHPIQAVTDGGQLTLRRGKDVVRWLMRVRPNMAESDEGLVAVVAHEVSHVALKSRGVRLADSTRNELLTETAAVLAGFGPLMRDAAYEEHWRTKVGGRAMMSIRQQGYLHQRTIEYLMGRRRELQKSATGAPTEPSC